MAVPGRLRGSYGLAVAVALLGLCPNVALQTAFFPLNQLVAHDLGAGLTGVQVTAGLASAAYAVGAVSGAQLAQRLGQRRLFLSYQAAFVVGSVLAAAAPGIVLFGVGRVVQGLAAGAMLISALPPLISRFGVARLPVTAVVVNIGIFGASALGPMIGGLAAAAGSWRALFVVSAALGMLGWVVAAVGYAEIDAADPDRPVDGAAVALTVVATVATFVGTSMLTGAPFVSPEVLLPLVVGLAALVLLLLVEDRRPDSLMPVRVLSTQLPVTGMVVASVGGAVFVMAAELAQLQLTRVAGHGPASIATLLWPLPVGVVVAAVCFGVLLRGRWVPVLVDVGLVALCAVPALLLAGGSTPSEELVLVVALLLGFGAGATVSPGLFLVGWSLPSTELGRAFALVQLVRSTVTYAVAPVVLHLAMSAGSLTSGVRLALVVTLVVAAGALVAALALPAVSGARLRRPDLEGWLAGDGPALPSPRTAVHARPGVEDDDAEPLLPRRRPGAR